jgi:hypothetical protein
MVLHTDWPDYDARANGFELICGDAQLDQDLNLFDITLTSIQKTTV